MRKKAPVSEHENKFMEIPYGYCHCGCGQKTTIIAYNCKTRNMIKGIPRQFIRGHVKREKHYRWNGGIQRRRGYVFIYKPEDPRAPIRNPYIAEHILVAESVLGKTLPIKAEVHHINGIRDDNRKENLIICENKAYHLMLHRRQKKFKEVTKNAG